MQIYDFLLNCMYKNVLNEEYVYMYIHKIGVCVLKKMRKLVRKVCSIYGMK